MQTFNVIVPQSDKAGVEITFSLLADQSEISFIDWIVRYSLKSFVTLKMHNN